MIDPSAPQFLGRVQRLQSRPDRHEEDGLERYYTSCVYVDGIHVYGGEDCPHTPENLGDEELPGWTVQQLG